MIPFGRDEPSEIRQRLSTDSLAGDGQPTPLVIGQPDPWVSELFEEDAVLLPQEVDRRLLVAIDPACECCEEDLPGLKGVDSRPEVTASDAVRRALGFGRLGRRSSLWTIRARSGRVVDQRFMMLPIDRIDGSP